MLKGGEHRPARSVEARDVDLGAMIEAADLPVVIRGLARDWPLVKAGLDGGADGAREYLAHHSTARPVEVNVGQPGGGDRLFYDADMAMNFSVHRAPMETILERMKASEEDPAAPLIYLSSIDMREAFNGLYEENHVDLGGRGESARIWIGNRTRIAAHNDMPDNLAVCAVGRRTFTVFPPEQFINLYLGPIEHTPAGRPVSMVDFAEPDLNRFPRFAEAISAAIVADLEPGDAIYIPSMWYHHVEARDRFNVLVNYWWRRTPRFMADPEMALAHAMLALRDLPDPARRRWRAIFDHYVFDANEETAAHLPKGKRGILDPLTPETAGSIRARLLRSLS